MEGQVVPTQYYFSLDIKGKVLHIRHQDEDISRKAY